MGDGREQNKHYDWCSCELCDANRRLELAEDRAKKLELALHNVRALATRMICRGTYGSDDGETLLRFCREVGVVPQILRDT